MKRFRKIYLEISNICNLKCSFCPGTMRERKIMSGDEIRTLLPKLKPWTDFLYFHIMGEPLCHPKLQEYLQLAGDYGFKVIITTNGTLLQRHQDMLLSEDALHKVNISLHAFEANDLNVSFEQYLNDCFSFGKAAENRKIICFRLWNNGGLDELNDKIISALQQHFPLPWTNERHGMRIGDKVYLEHGDKFDWPDLNTDDLGENCFCYGLRDQIGILCDGTVVPCCLDHEGDIPLGNLFIQEMDEILNSKKAVDIYKGFSDGIAINALCRRCGYARRFRN